MAYKLPKKWSPQATDFLDKAVNGKDNIVVEAVAGAGKTTVLLAAILGLIQKGNTVCFLVFNKKNAVETEAKFADLGIKWPNACSTVHSAGFKALRNTFKNLQLDTEKVRKIVDRLYPNYAHASVVCQLVSYAKQKCIGVLTPIDDEQNWMDLITHHNMIDEDFHGDDVAVAIKRAMKTLEANNQDTRTINFDDQIYLCLVHPCRFDKYDVVIIDEAQDTNDCRREIAKRLMKK